MKQQLLDQIASAWRSARAEPDPKIRTAWLEAGIALAAALTPSSEVPQYATTVGPEDHAFLCYVNADGVVRLPEDIIKRFGIEAGDGVVFIENKAGRFEMLTDEQFLEMFESSDEDEED